jgi:hypothetical protein
MVTRIHPAHLKTFKQRQIQQLMQQFEVCYPITKDNIYFDQVMAQQLNTRTESIVKAESFIKKFGALNSLAHPMFSVITSANTSNEEFMKLMSNDPVQSSVIPTTTTNTLSKIKDTFVNTFGSMSYAWPQAAAMVNTNNNNTIMVTPNKKKKRANDDSTFDLKPFEFQPNTGIIYSNESVSSSESMDLDQTEQIIELRQHNNALINQYESASKQYKLKSDERTIEIQELKKLMDELSQERDETSRININQSANIQALTIAKEHLQDENEIMKQDTLKYKDEIQKLYQRISNLRQDADNIINSQGDTIDKQHAQMNERIIEIQRFITDNENLTIQVDTLRTSMNTLQQKVDSYQKENERLMSLQSKPIESEEAYQNLKQAHNIQLSLMQQDLASKHNELQDLRTWYEQDKLQLAQQSQSVAQLQQSHSTEVNRLQNENKNLQNQLQHLQNQLQQQLQQAQAETKPVQIEMKTATPISGESSSSSFHKNKYISDPISELPFTINSFKYETMRPSLKTNLNPSSSVSVSFLVLCLALSSA